MCALPGIVEGVAKPPVPIPGDGEFDAIAVAVPPMIGAEYLTADVLANLWRDMDAAFDAELEEATLSVQEYLKSRHAAWNLIGRVPFWRSAKPCRSTPVQETESVCCRCWCSTTK
jgi:non-specific serine/threonine protein kinase